MVMANLTAGIVFTIMKKIKEWNLFTKQNFFTVTFLLFNEVN